MPDPQDRPPTQRNGNGNEFAPLLPPIPVWVKFVLYLLAQSANGLLMFNAFRADVVVIDGVPTAQPSSGQIACSVVIFVVGSIVQVIRSRKP